MTKTVSRAPNNPQSAQKAPDAKRELRLTTKRMGVFRQTKPGVWIRTNGAGETVCLGERIGRRLATGDVLCLTGEVGSGKTTFVKGLAKGFGLKVAVDEVVSPTFVLIRQYPCHLPLYHVDLYRLEFLTRTERGLLDECLTSGGVTVVEWGERVTDMLPTRRLDICFEHLGGDRRRVRVTPQGGFPWPGR